MKEKIVYVLDKIIYFVGLFFLIYLAYTFLMTLIGVEYGVYTRESMKFSNPNELFALNYDFNTFYLNSYLRILTTNDLNFFTSQAFPGQLILEIVLFASPITIYIAKKIYIRRDKIAEWFRKIPTTSKKVKELEKQIEELKKEKH